MDEHIKLTDVTLRYDKAAQSVLAPINLTIKRGEFIAVIGRSGCGKTSLLQMIAGLVKPTSGVVMMNGTVVTQPRDEMAYLFQRPVLLEWCTVMENMLLSLKFKRRIHKEDCEEAKKWLELVGLKDIHGQYPHQLSGGMQARVSIARAFLTKPEVLLMDEPFSSLDAMTKEQLHTEMVNLFTEIKPTIIFITHDIQEAIFLSDRIMILDGNPSQVVKEYQISFERPRNKQLKFEPDFLQQAKEIYNEVERNCGK